MAVFCPCNRFSSILLERSYKADLVDLMVQLSEFPGFPAKCHCCYFNHFRFKDKLEFITGIQILRSLIQNRTKLAIFFPLECHKRF